MTIMLVGYRATGKSSVARRLAEILHYDWKDVDDEVEVRADKSIAEIFAESGEKSFRDIEEQVLLDLARRSNTVIATGGGSVLRSACRQAMKAAGPVIWLQATAEMIDRRMHADPMTAQRRPSLTEQGGIAEIDRLLEERTPKYAEVATHQVDTAGKSPQQIAEQIARLIRVDDGAESRDAPN